MSDGPIPACAGQPLRALAPIAPSWAYPRVCGATALSACACACFAGLSPRVRGNLAHAADGESSSGPIPACAGQPLNPSGLSLGFWAYPRVCGATELIAGAIVLGLGLSPRVRGNPADDFCARNPGGPIPACAGQPTSACRSSSKATAYPRVCGATTRFAKYKPSRSGLSPRVRGNLICPNECVVTVGPIPACAGQPC